MEVSAQSLILYVCIVHFLVVKTLTASLCQTVQYTLSEVGNNVCDLRQDLARHQEQQSQRGRQTHYTIVRCMMQSAADSQTQEFNQHYDQITTDGIGPTDSTFVLVQPYSPRSSTGSQKSDNYRGSPCDGTCLSSCRCRCHSPPISLVPQLLRFLVGNMVVDHDWISALVSARTPCNDQECKRHRSNLLKIKYHCPSWFAQINAEIRTKRFPVYFVIQTPRIVSTLGWLETATLDEVRRKLSNRELTVNDTNAAGESVLHVRLYLSQSPDVKLTFVVAGCHV